MLSCSIFFFASDSDKSDCDALLIAVTRACTNVDTCAQFLAAAKIGAADRMIELLDEGAHIESKDTVCLMSACTLVFESNESIRKTLVSLMIPISSRP